MHRFLAIIIAVLAASVAALPTTDGVAARNYIDPDDRKTLPLPK
jgi:hypothetical protein